MSDIECLDFFYKNIKNKKLTIRYISKNFPIFINYIKNRFNDSNNETISELIYRIENKIEEIPKCPVCGKLVKYDKNKKHYRTFCSKECELTTIGQKIMKEKRFNTKLMRYGSGYFNNREKYKQTCLEKYGKEHVILTKEEKDKINIKIKETCLKKFNEPIYAQEKKKKRKRTCLEKYGVEHSSQNEEIKEKRKRTCLEKYGVEYISQSDEIKKKIKMTCLEKYGVENAIQSSQVKEKIKMTCLEKYGVENAMQSDIIKNKVKQIFLQKYGVSTFFKTDEIKIKSKQTWLNKYGVDHPFKSDEIRNKIMKTCFERYGYESAMKNKDIILKSFEKRIKSNKISKYSKKENEIYNYLITIDKAIKRQYYTEEYPFHCDFYLPNFDLYIEYNGAWTHGKHPFNKDNEDDIEILNNWKIKSETSKFYKSAIETWTIRDVNKRNLAYKNKLNFIEIWYVDKNYHIIGYYQGKYIDTVMPQLFDRHEMIQ